MPYSFQIFFREKKSWKNGRAVGQVKLAHKNTGRPRVSPYLIRNKMGGFERVKNGRVQVEPTNFSPFCHVSPLKDGWVKVVMWRPTLLNRLTHRTNKWDTYKSGLDTRPSPFKTDGWRQSFKAYYLTVNA